MTSCDGEIISEINIVEMSKPLLVTLMRALALGHPPPLVFKQNNTGTNILGATFNYYFERAH